MKHTEVRIGKRKRESGVSFDLVRELKSEGFHAVLSRNLIFILKIEHNIKYPYGDFWPSSEQLGIAVRA